MMPEYMRLFDDAMNCDAWTQPDNDSLFRAFLEDCRVICHLQVAAKGSAHFRLKHWYDRSEAQYGDYPMYGSIRESMTLLLPGLLKRLQWLKEWVANSHYFWENNDRHYLESVLAIPVPENVDSVKPDDWGHEIAMILGNSGYLI